MLAALLKEHGDCGTGNNDPGEEKGQVLESAPVGKLSAAVTELANLMDESGIRIKVWDSGRGLAVDWRCNDFWVTSNRDKARRLEDLIYRDEPTVSLLALLDDGIYNAAALLWFAGETPQRGRGGNAGN